MFLLINVVIISGKIPTGFRYQAKLHCELIILLLSVQPPGAISHGLYDMKFVPVIYIMI